MPTVALPTFRVRSLPFVCVYRPAGHRLLGVCACSSGTEHIGIDIFAYSSAFYCVARNRSSGGAPSNFQIKTFYIIQFEISKSIYIKIVLNVYIYLLTYSMVQSPS